MLIAKHTITTTATPNDIWNIWKDIKNWHTWDNITESYSLNGPFQTGTTGEWKAKDSPVVKVTLTQVEPLKVYVGEVKLFLARFISSHFINVVDGTTQVTQQFEVKGPLAFLYAWHLGPKLKRDLVIEMESLKKKAESLRKI